MESVCLYPFIGRPTRPPTVDLASIRTQYTCCIDRPSCPVFIPPDTQHNTPHNRYRKRGTWRPAIAYALGAVGRVRGQSVHSFMCLCLDPVISSPIHNARSLPIPSCVCALTWPPRPSTSTNHDHTADRMRASLWPGRHLRRWARAWPTRARRRARALLCHPCIYIDIYIALLVCFQTTNLFPTQHNTTQHNTATQSREWLERIGNAPAGLGGGGTALLLRVPWIEASVAGGKEVREGGRQAGTGKGTGTASVGPLTIRIDRFPWIPAHTFHIPNPQQSINPSINSKGVGGVPGAGRADGAANRRGAVGQVGLGPEAAAGAPRGDVRPPLPCLALRVLMQLADEATLTNL